jgi:hypothetical protein
MPVAGPERGRLAKFPSAEVDLGLWIAGALMTLIAFVSSFKSASERATWRVLLFRGNAAGAASLSALPH